MKHMILAIVLLLCSPLFAATPPALSASVRIVTPIGFGHACAVAPNILLTARHVVRKERETLGVRWSSGDVGGTAKFVGDWGNADIALLVTDVPLPHVGELAENVAAGDEVWWAEYDWSKRSRAYKSVIRSGKVSELFAGSIGLDDETPVPGASGGCLVNAEGQIVGIISGGVQMDDDSTAGNAVATYGIWAQTIRSAIASLSETFK